MVRAAVLLSINHSRPWWLMALAIRDARSLMLSCQEIYQRYAAVLYRQALLHSGDPAPPEHDPGDAIVNEHAVAAINRRTRAGRDGGIHPRAADLRPAGTS
jgi:hypothetical protein